MRRVVFKARFLWLVLLAMIVGVWPMAAQAAAPPTGFTLLSAAPNGLGAVTCTTSTVNGNVGSSGGSASVTNTGCTITGAITTSVSTTGFDSAYSALAGVPCDPTKILTTLDVTQTLTPGVYCFAAGATATTKVLTLKGPTNGIWLFKIGTGGTGALTGTDFSVVMAGGAQPCNVNWWVAQAATLTVDNGKTVPSTPFSGNILAGAAAKATGTATATSALTLTGRVWARAGVTVTDSTIVGCASAIPVPKTKCKPGTSNDEDENAEQSKDTSDSNKSVSSAAAGASQSSKDDGKDENGKQDNDKGNKGCNSDNSNHGDKQSKDS